MYGITLACLLMPCPTLASRAPRAAAPAAGTGMGHARAREGHGCGRVGIGGTSEGQCQWGSWKGLGAVGSGLG